LKARDFRQHIFGFGFHFKVRQFAVPIVFDARFALNGVKHPQHSGQLMFGQQADVQIQTMLPCFRPPLLARCWPDRQTDGDLSGRAWKAKPLASCALTELQGARSDKPPGRLTAWPLT
jgi:hypothetical protein